MMRRLGIILDWLCGMSTHSTPPTPSTRSKENLALMTYHHLNGTTTSYSGDWVTLRSSSNKNGTVYINISFMPLTSDKGPMEHEIKSTKRPTSSMTLSSSQDSWTFTGNYSLKFQPGRRTSAT